MKICDCDTRRNSGRRLYSRPGSGWPNFTVFTRHYKDSFLTIAFAQAAQRHLERLGRRLRHTTVSQGTLKTACCDFLKFGLRRIKNKGKISYWRQTTSRDISYKGMEMGFTAKWLSIWGKTARVPKFCREVIHWIFV